MLLMNNEKFEFKVYSIYTNKTGHINFYAHHYSIMKNVIIVSFYLRTLTLCITNINDRYSRKRLSFLDKVFEH